MSQSVKPETPEQRPQAPSETSPAATSTLERIGLAANQQATTADAQSPEAISPAMARNLDAWRAARAGQSATGQGDQGSQGEGEGEGQQRVGAASGLAPAATAKASDAPTTPADAAAEAVAPIRPPRAIGEEAKEAAAAWTSENATEEEREMAQKLDQYLPAMRENQAAVAERWNQGTQATLTPEMRNTSRISQRITASSPVHELTRQGKPLPEPSAAIRNELTAMVSRLNASRTPSQTVAPTVAPRTGPKV
jgi:hypothetical protein